MSTFKYFNKILSFDKTIYPKILAISILTTMSFMAWSNDETLNGETFDDEMDIGNIYFNNNDELINRYCKMKCSKLNESEHDECIGACIFMESVKSSIESEY